MDCYSFTVSTTFVSTLVLASTLMVFANAQCIAQDPPLTCADLMVDTIAYRRNVTGLLIDAYTCGTMAFIGCTSNGCDPETFFCNDNADGISFGTNSTDKALRVILGSLPLPEESFGCADAGNFTSTVNAPDQMADATVLCNQLGYTTASFFAVDDNGCPEASILFGDCWSSDFNRTDGYGKNFTCSNDCSASGEEQDCVDVCTSESPSGSPSASPSAPPSAASGSPSAPPSTPPTASPSGSPSGSPVGSGSESNSESDSVDNALSVADRSNELSSKNGSLSAASMFNVDYVIDIDSSTSMQIFAMLLLFMIVNVLIFCCYRYHRQK